jgi:hypothetical protein
VINNRRTLAYVAIALIVGAALALAVALASGGTTPSSTSSTAAPTRTSPALLGETAATGSTSSDPLSADPAKEEPLLDKFVSKDPFVPLTTASTVNPVTPAEPGVKAKVKGTNGHTISILSISETNSTGLATIDVDGKTYSDKKVGAVFSTSWGEIKVIAINVSAQTVTLMHGDQTITLRAGQVVVK